MNPQLHIPYVTPNALPSVAPFPIGTLLRGRRATTADRYGLAPANPRLPKAGKTSTMPCVSWHVLEPFRAISREMCNPDLADTTRQRVTSTERVNGPMPLNVTTDRPTAAAALHNSAIVGNGQIRR
ncbi:hypothetical protein ACFYPC_35435 [Streptomyces sp. NPDC005808]|uniref:hypothetical protein n=1 Tax=Streptomyces sp. NPDC005808 TaxID=3364734 RepID=UPI0036809290